MLLFRGETVPSNYEILKDDIEFVNKIISDIITENPDFEIFINSVVIKNRKRDALNQRLVVNPLEYVAGNQVDRMQSLFSSEPRRMKVILSDLNTSQAESIISHHDTDYRFSLDEIYKYDFLPKRKKHQIEIINIFPDVKGFKGKFSDTHHYNRSNKNIKYLLSVGKNNIFLGLLTVDSILYLKWSVIKSLLKSKDGENKVKELFTKLFTLYVNEQQMTTECFIKKLSSDLKSANTRQLVLLSNFYQKDITDKNKLKYFINSNIKKTIKRTLKGTIHDVDSPSKYQELFSNVMHKMISQYKEDVNKSYKLGLKSSFNFVNNGWNPANPDDKAIQDRGSFWFSKDVNIVPDRFIYEGVNYIIPESHRDYFKIEKLYVSIDYKLRCKGAHPNVNYGDVCMGDLRFDKIKADSEDEKIDIFLKRAESLLEIINYDSAYDSAKRSILLDVSTKADALNIQKIQKKKLKFRSFNDSNSMLPDFKQSDEIDTTQVYPNMDSDINDDLATNKSIQIVNELIEDFKNSCPSLITGSELSSISIANKLVFKIGNTTKYIVIIEPKRYYDYRLCFIDRIDAVPYEITTKRISRFLPYLIHLKGYVSDNIAKYVGYSSSWDMILDYLSKNNLIMTDKDQQEELDI